MLPFDVGRPRVRSLGYRERAAPAGSGDEIVKSGEVFVQIMRETDIDGAKRPISVGTQNRITFSKLAARWTQKQ